MFLMARIPLVRAIRFPCLDGSFTQVMETPRKGVGSQCSAIFGICCPMSPVLCDAGGQGAQGLNEALTESLEFWRWLLARHHRSRSLWEDDQTDCDVLIFTDGFTPDPRAWLKEEAQGGDVPRIGWLALDKATEQATVCAWEVPTQMVEGSLERRKSL